MSRAGWQANLFSEPNPGNGPPPQPPERYFLPDLTIWICLCLVGPVLTDLENYGIKVLARSAGPQVVALARQAPRFHQLTSSNPFSVCDHTVDAPGHRTDLGMTILDGNSRTHNADGNLTTGRLPADHSQTATLSWNGENRLTTSKIGSGATTAYYCDYPGALDAWLLRAGKTK